MQLATLEREVGVPLTERSGRRLVLTPAGRLLAAHGRDLIDRLALAELELGAIRDGRVGSYRLAAFPTAARTFVADVWRDLVHTEDALELHLTTPEPEDALVALGSGEVHLAVVHSYSNVARNIPTGIVAVPLATEPVLVAMPSDDPLLRQRKSCATVSLDELASRRWISAEKPYTCQEMTERACGLAGFVPSVAAETIDFPTQLELVAAGVGVALIPHLASTNVPTGVTMIEPHQPLRRHLFACTRTASDGDAALTRLITLLREAATKRLIPANARTRDLRSPSKASTDKPARS